MNLSPQYGEKLVTKFVTNFGDKLGEKFGEKFGENQVFTKFGDEFVTTIWGKTGHQICHQFW